MKKQKQGKFIQMADNWQETAQLYEQLFQTPQMKENLLQKPAFKYIQDIFFATMENTGFGNGLFQGEELDYDSKSFEDQESQLAFLVKVITLTEMMAGEKIDIKPSMVLACQEADKTNSWLQMMYHAATSGVDSSPYVQQIVGVGNEQEEEQPEDDGAEEAARQAQEEQQRQQAEKIEKEAQRKKAQDKKNRQNQEMQPPEEENERQKQERRYKRKKFIETLSDDGGVQSATEEEQKDVPDTNMDSPNFNTSMQLQKVEQKSDSTLSNILQNHKQESSSSNIRLKKSLQTTSEGQIEERDLEDGEQKDMQLMFSQPLQEDENQNSPTVEEEPFQIEYTEKKFTTKKKVSEEESKVMQPQHMSFDKESSSLPPITPQKNIKQQPYFTNLESGQEKIESSAEFEEGQTLQNLGEENDSSMDNSITELIIRKKQLEMELIELDITQRVKKRDRKYSASRSRSRSPIGRPSSAKPRGKPSNRYTNSNAESFEYFQPDELSNISNTEIMKTGLSTNPNRINKKRLKQNKPTQNNIEDQQFDRIRQQPLIENVDEMDQEDIQFQSHSKNYNSQINSLIRKSQTPKQDLFLESEGSNTNPVNESQQAQAQDILHTQGPDEQVDQASALRKTSRDQAASQLKNIVTVDETIEPKFNNDSSDDDQEHSQIIKKKKGKKQKKKKDKKKRDKEDLTRTLDMSTVRQNRDSKPRKDGAQRQSAPGGDGPGNYPLPMEMLGNFQEEDDINFFEPISFKKLEKVISTRHPVDPETKARFSLKDRVTVNEYEAKVSDACFCYAASQFIKELSKKIKKSVKGPKSKSFDRPPSMADMPESNSSSESGDDGALKGLTQCSISLGEGATLYLQMMKTISLMFLVLTILNLPLFFFYEYSTTGNQLGNFQKVFKYYTIGNLGQQNRKCSYSSFDYYFNSSIEEPSPPIEVNCGEGGYIGELQSFGFLYKFDKQYGDDTIAAERCKYIEDPQIRYKKPTPRPWCVEDVEPGDPGYIADCIEVCASSLEPNVPEGCQFKPTQDEVSKTDQRESEAKDSKKQDKNKTEEQQVTMNNVDPICQFVNKTKQYKKTFWANDLSEAAFRRWFDDECYFNQSCTFDVTKMAGSLNREELAQKTVVDVRVATTDRHSDETALDGADDILNEEEEESGDKQEELQPVTFFDMVSDNCKQRMNDIKVTSFEYIGVVGCKYDDVTVPMTQIRLHKEWIGIIIIVCDVMSICIIYYFFAKIRVINMEVLRAMDDLKVQMKDFGIKIDDLRLDRFTQDSRLIKFKIWLHFTKIFQNHEIMHDYEDAESREEEDAKREQAELAKIRAAGGDESNNQSAPEPGDVPAAGPARDTHTAGYNFTLHPTHQVLDVCLSIYTQPSIQCVFRMQDIQLEINNINNKLHSGGYQEEEIPDKQDELKMLTEKQKRFEARYNQLTQMKKHKAGQTLTVQRVPKSQRLKEIQYVFVIFKNCETADVVQDIIPSQTSMLKKQIPERNLFGKPMKIVPILEPDEIIWENLAYTGEQQQVRRYIMQTVAFFFLIANTLFTMYLAGFKSYLNTKIPALNCDPELTYSKEDAYKDHMKSYNKNDNDNPQGILGCYCSRETTPFVPWVFIPHNFREFNDLIPEGMGQVVDNWNHCASWYGLQAAKEVLLFFISTSAVFINEIVADFFQELGQFQKKHTKLEEQITCFRQIFSQEYINMGIIVLITSFDQIGLKQAILGDLAGGGNVYTSFEPNWYMDYGNKICIFIFMSSFVVNSKDIVKFIITVIKRFRDRSFKMNLKLDPDDEGCDKPNTKIRIQSDLETLYTGKEFKGEKAYSRMMSTLFVLLMYSSGMPILYLIGTVFYLVTYWVNKFLLINYYKKSTTLTRTIPLFAMDFMKYSLFMHSIVSLLMLTNPVAFKTKNRFKTVEGEQVLQGVDPIFSTKDLIHNLVRGVLNTTTDATEAEILAKEAEVDSNLVVAFVRHRMQFFHQQLFFTFLITYVITLLLGQTIYGIFYVIIIMIWQAIKFLIRVTTSYMKRKAVQAEQAIKNKMLRRGANVREKPVNLVALEPPNAQGQNISSNSFGTDQSLRIANQSPDFQVHQPLRENVGIELNESQLESNQPGSTSNNDREIQRKKHQLKQQNRPDYSDNILMELSCENLSNFYQRSKKERQDFWEIFQWHQEIGDELLTDNYGGEGLYDDHRTLFLETLYTYRINQDDVIFYQNFLNDRIIEMETIIDRYFNTFKNILFNKMQEGYARDRARLKKMGKEGSLKEQVDRRKHEEWALVHSDDVQFDDPEHFPYERKLKILVEYQDDLIQADKDRKENRRGIQEICRMTGSLAQSYFIFDCSTYKVGRKIYYAVNEEEEEKDDENDICEILGQQTQNNIQTSQSSSSSSSETSEEQEDSDGLQAQRKNQKSRLSATVVTPSSRAKNLLEQNIKNTMSKKSQKNSTGRAPTSSKRSGSRKSPMSNNGNNDKTLSILSAGIAKKVSLQGQQKK